MLLPAIFIHLGTLDLLLLLLNLVLHHLLLYHVLTLLPILVFVLLGDEFALLSLLLLVEHDRVLYLLGLHVPLLLHHLNVLSVLFLSLLLLYLELHFLLCTLLVFILQPLDIRGPLLRLLDLLPRLQFLLLQEGYTVRQ